MMMRIAVGAALAHMATATIRKTNYADDPNMGMPTTCGAVNDLPDEYQIHGKVDFCTVEEQSLFKWPCAGGYRTIDDYADEWNRKKFECNFLDGCVWDEASSACNDGPCVGLTGDACTTHSECMLDANDQCLPVQCSKYTTSGDCGGAAAVLGCVWIDDDRWGASGGQCVDNAFSTCPALDLTLFLDGSASMATDFEFKEGNFGWWEMLTSLKRGMRRLPLSGDAHTEHMAGRGKDVGMRVNMVQFSDSSEGHHSDPADCGGLACTGGYLSGSREELLGELNWQNDKNYMMKATFLGPALRDVSPKFPPALSTGRVQLAVVLTDGQLTETERRPTDSIRQEFDEVVNDVKNLGVNVHMVVMYPGAVADDKHQALTTGANAQVVSTPAADHMHLVHPSHLIEHMLEKVCTDFLPVDVDECAAGNAGAEKCDGQNCTDADTSVLGTFVCTCKGGADGVGSSTEPGQRATCAVDECAYHGGDEECDKFGQECDDTQDPQGPYAMENYVCSCAAPSEAKAEGAREPTTGSACVIDECEAVCTTCEQTTVGGPEACAEAGRECLDLGTDAEDAHNWVCYCASSPASWVTGGSVGTAGQCPAHNECRDESEATLSGTHIPRYTRRGCECRTDWEVTAGGTGPGSAAGGPCYDGCCNPDNEPTVWCFVDQGSVYNQGKAGCADEVWGFCTPTGMEPVDGGVPRPYRGSSATPPNVTRDTLANVSDEETNKCTDAGQTCHDQTAGDGDWQCVCILPRTGTADLMPVVTCELDECVTNRGTCEGADPPQDCVDELKDPADSNSANSWVCRCRDGATASDGTGNQSRATCVLNECTDNCPTCAAKDDDGNNYCAQNGQVCDDPVKTDGSTGDWRCICDTSLGHTGARPESAGVYATCTLNECTAVCATCQEVAGNAAKKCDDRNQTCTDQQQGVDELGDWTCSCPEPTLSSPAKADYVQMCVRNECEQVCDTCEKTMAGFETCADAGQACKETSQEVERDWYCECQLPYRGTDGTPLAPLATNCKHNECDDHADDCRGQLCRDDNQMMDDTWTCDCSEPDETGTAGRPATCMAVGDCEGNTVCHDVGQVCHDPQPGTAGAWSCECIGDGVVETLPGDMGVATCELNECEAVCATCQRTEAGQGEYCVGHGQQCEDIDRGVTGTALGSWQCTCATGYNGTAGRPATSCELDECLTAVTQVCVDAQQGCRDDIPTADGGWYCVCTTGLGTEQEGDKVDVCQENECAVGGRCSPGSVCEDHNLTALDTWWCHCDPDEGRVPAVKGGSPTCNEYDECLMTCDSGCPAQPGDNDTVCSRVGQTCRDPLPLSNHDNWECVCAPPSVGSNTGDAVRADACALNECTEQCQTCATRGDGNVTVCTGAGMECVDDTPHTGAGGLDSWLCRCPGDLSSITTKTPTPDTCALNECTDTLPGETAPRGDCGSQDCRDTQPGLGDFVCTCNGEGETGAATGEEARCLVNECELEANAAVCSAVANEFYGIAQTCIDPAPYATRDNWFCKCPLPAVQSGTSVQAGAARGAQAAVCSHNECGEADKAAVCAERWGQECFDDDHTMNDSWTCRCVGLPAGTVRQPGRPATCEVNECDAITTCADEVPAQECQDSTGRVDGDWKCMCVVGIGEPGQPANCAQVVPDCERYGSACTGNQTCVDTDPLTEDTWACSCGPPSYLEEDNGTVPDCGAVEVNECAEHGHECVQAEQYCKMDEGRWACFCFAPSNQKNPGGRVETCSYNECTTSTDVCPGCAGSTCEDAADGHGAQTCVDENVTEPGSWVCRCASSDVSAQRGYAECRTGITSVDAATTTATTTTPTNPADNGGAGVGDDGCGSFLECYWWVLLLLLLLCCCCCLLLLLLVLRRRKVETDEDATKWNKQFKADGNIGEFEEFGMRDMEDGDTMTQSILQSEHGMGSARFNEVSEEEL